MNRNYRRSADRERAVKKMLEADGWYAIRAAGSHGKADVIAIRPAAGVCADPWHYEVRFIQIKVSTKLKNYQETVEAVDTPGGTINLETWKFPIKKRRKKLK